MFRISLISMALLAVLALSANAQPELEAWVINRTGATGYGGLHADVDSVQFSETNAYVRCSGIPSYDIGPWPDGNPNIPADQQYLFRIPRLHEENMGTKTSTPLGHIGVWVNGVPIYNPLDAHSYLNRGIWHQNAVVVEADGFDACLGHPAMGGRYHHHQNPVCLYQASPDHHSPIIGYAFDGFPVYGPYAYANADGSGGITRMRSSYRLRDITQRHTLADGTVLATTQYGPDVSATYPLGYYVEDYEYVEGLGDLDEHNGRLTVTPEYPDGVYAYYATIEESGASAYPYTIGPTYFGVVATDNWHTGQVTIGEPVSLYDGPTTSVGTDALQGFRFLASAPNPTRAGTTLNFVLGEEGEVGLAVYDPAGRLVRRLLSGRLDAGPHAVNWDGSDAAGVPLDPGVYFVAGRFRGERHTETIVVLR